MIDDASLDLVADGRMGHVTRDQIKIPCYFRTIGELLSPLEREDSPVCGAFSVDRFGILEASPPFLVAFRRDSDAEAYASACTDFLRAVTEPVFRGVLEENGAVEGLYERIQARLAAGPGRYPWSYTLVAALLTRR